MRKLKRCERLRLLYGADIDWGKLERNEQDRIRSRDLKARRRLKDYARRLLQCDDWAGEPR